VNYLQLLDRNYTEANCKSGKKVKFRYFYFVYYETNNTFGNVEVETDCIIDTFNKIIKVQELIQSHYKIKNLAIVNFQLLRKKKVDNAK
jgi:hypothetical protein